MNKITGAIALVEKQIGEKVKTLSPEKLESTNRSLDMSFEEFCLFQERKSLAQAEGRLSHEEAQTVYTLLGSSPEHFNGQSLAAKVVLTKLFQELLSPRK